jgi:hypothetical protein
MDQNQDHNLDLSGPSPLVTQDLEDDVLCAWTYVPADGPQTPLHGIDVIVREDASGTYQLSWGDRVANVWTENFHDPAELFVRLGVLLRAVRDDRFLAHQPANDDVFTDLGAPVPEGFLLDASAFIDGQLDAPVEEGR